MSHRVRDLSSEQRLAIESLIGRKLQDDEGLSIQPSHILHEAPVGEERSRAYASYLGHLELLSSRVGDIPDPELDAVIDAACDYARHSHSRS